MNGFKVLAVINEKAYENWKAFSRNLLTHVNPYTQKAYKDDPGLAWLSLINEGNLGNYLNLIREIPDYRQAWNRWLVGHYGDRSGLAAGLGEDSAGATRIRARGTVRSGRQHLQSGSAGTRPGAIPERRRTGLSPAGHTFLREEIGTQALITNMNAWTNHVVYAGRAGGDGLRGRPLLRRPSRVHRTALATAQPLPEHESCRGRSQWRSADHFHPSDAIGRSRCPSTTTLRRACIAEWAASSPARWAHCRDGESSGDSPTRTIGTTCLSRDGMDYFNMVSDPLGQAAERASICLFLRGDMQAAPRSLAIAMTPQDLAQPPARIPSLAPAWHWAAWVTRVGTRVVTDPAATPAR